MSTVRIGLPAYDDRGTFAVVVHVYGILTLDEAKELAEHMEPAARKAAAAQGYELTPERWAARHVALLGGRS